MSARFIYTILLFSIPFYSISQDDEFEIVLTYDSTVYADSYCETWKNMAKADTANGHYVCFIHGYRSNNSETFERLMLRKYGVHAIRTGWCMGDKNMDCYNTISIPIIKERFGEDVFSRTRHEADSLDRIGLGDRKAYYAQGWKEFRKIIYQELDSKLLKKFSPRKDYPRPNVTFFVNEMGKIYRCGIRSCENQEVITEINRIIPHLPQMVYTTEDGKAIKDSIVFTLPIHRRKRH